MGTLKQFLKEVNTAYQYEKEEKEGFKKILFDLSQKEGCSRFSIYIYYAYQFCCDKEGKLHYGKRVPYKVEICEDGKSIKCVESETNFIKSSQPFGYFTL